MNLLSEIEFSKLILEISGVEAIHYKSPPRRQLSEDSVVPKSVEAKEKKELFRSRAIVFEAPGGRLSPGHYRFPFIFVLPSGIPGSASVAGADVGRDEAGEYSAEVKYLLRAEFEDCFIFIKDLHAIAAGVPTAPPEVPHSAAPESAADAVSAATAAAAAARVEAAGARGEAVSPQPGEASLSAQPNRSSESMRRFPLKLLDILELFIVEPPQEKVPSHLVEQTIPSKRFLFCLKPHIVVAGLGLRNTYLNDGDLFEVQIEVDNPSHYAITEVVLAVWRITTLRAPGLRPYVVRNRMVYQQVTSIPPGFYLRGESGLQSDVEIPFDLQQSVKASLFDVAYEVALTADFRKSGVDVRDNIIIRKRLTPQAEHLKELLAPPGWENVQVTTELLRIQVEGAPAPDVGNFEGIGYVKVPANTGQGADAASP